MSTKTFSKRIQSIEVSAIKQMALKAEKYDNVIRLAWGVPCFSSHQNIRQAVVDAFKNDPDIDKYAPVPGLLLLREKVKKLCAEKFDYEIGIDQVIVTGGAMEALMCLMHTLFDPGDALMVMDPGFSSHIEQMLLTGVTPQYVSLEEGEKAWHLTKEALENVVTPETKAFILINPHNPTGQVFSKEDIEIIADFVREHNLWLILDEPYSYLVFDDKEIYHPLKVKDIRDQIIMIHSFSKKYSMTGWRVGYVVAPSREMMLEIMKVHDATMVSTSRVAQIAAQAALSIPEEELKDEQHAMQDRRDQVCDILDTMPDLFSYVRPSGAYYIFPKIIAPGLDDVTFANRILEDVQVVTTPGYAFGPTGKNHIRICYSGSEQDLREGGERMQKWWKENKTGYRG